MANVTRATAPGSGAQLRQLLSRFNKARDLIQLGAYAPGHDAELDTAVHPGDARVAAAGHARERTADEASVQQLRGVVAGT